MIPSVRRLLLSGLGRPPAMRSTNRSSPERDTAYKASELGLDGREPTLFPPGDQPVRGEPADHRSDIFSFGCVLYEMLSGQVAFRRDNAVETMNAILKEEPPEFSGPDRAGFPPGLERIARKCLEKAPEQRLQSASELAFAIEALSGVSTPRAPESPVKPRATRRRAAIAAGLLLTIMGAFAVRLAVRKAPAATVPLFRRLSFRRGTIYSARFTPDGKSLIYGAEWEGKPLQ